MTCDCIGYNRPEPYQKTPSVEMTPPLRFSAKPIMVDACITDQINALWEAGIWTHSTCCGHNGQFPRHVVVDKFDAIKAKEVLSTYERPLTVNFWVLASI